MKKKTLQERSDFYSKEFPKFPPLRADDRWIDGMWIMGNNYTTSGLYGAYPHGYLKRIMALFPDAKNILHLFSGSLPKGNYTRFDIKPENADIVGNAHKLSEYFGSNKFDLILADPPYSIEDCEHYGTSMIKRNTVMKECYKILDDNGFIVWLDQVLPMFRKIELNMCGVIGMVKSTNHRFRVVTIFEKVVDGLL